MQETSTGRNRWGLALAAALAVLTIALVMLRRETPLDVPLTKLELTPLTGSAGPVTLADLKGRVALVNFWGTWCPPCRQEFPHIVELERSFRDAPDFKLLAVSVGNGEAPQELRANTLEFLKHTGAENFVTYTDPDSVTMAAVSDALHSGGFVFPTTIVVDREGIIRALWRGYRPGVEGEMAAAVDRWLKKK
jgi:thiol-disulfide isomerase/thioredoxin